MIKIAERKSTLLSVNIDKIALLRNSRDIGVPDIISFAKICLEAGAGGITVHPRKDKRHILFEDCFALAELKSEYDFEINIEGELSDPVISLVEQVKPDQFTVVIEDDDELTSTRGWEGDQSQTHLQDKVAKLNDVTCVSVFCNPEADSINFALKAGAKAIEIFTGPYANAKTVAAKQIELNKIKAAADIVKGGGLKLNGGHDLNCSNLPDLVKTVQFDEFSIGHHLISDALVDGIANSVSRYIEVIEAI